jgi:transcription elongation factor GreA
MTETPDDAPQLTRAAHERLRDELEELRSSGRRDAAERLQRARELGDLGENAEYHEAKNHQGFLEARIRRLEHIVRTARIVEAPAQADRAVAGTFVTLRPLDGGEEEVYLLAASSEERARGARTLTVASPLGQALRDRTVGDTVDYQAPGGKFAYELLKIEPWLGDR